MLLFKMKRSIIFHLLLATALVLGGSVGCKKRAKSPTPITPGQVVVPRPLGEVGGGELAPRVIDTTGGVASNPLSGRDPGATGFTDPQPFTPLDPILDKMIPNEAFFSANTIYFDYDQAAVKASERGKVEGVAKYLESNPTHAVRVAGHCDERGTEGYNLSLGERRAHAVREYLMKLGVPGNRIGTISYGEAQPVALGHNEAAYKQNRRGVFILLTP